MPVFECRACDGITCTTVVTCNDDEFITNLDGTCDDLGCIRRVMRDRAVWRRQDPQDRCEMFGACYEPGPGEGGGMIPEERPTNLKLTLDLNTGEVLKNELIYRSEMKNKRNYGRGRPKKKVAA